MNNKQNEQGKTQQPQAGDRAPARAAGRAGQPAPCEHQSARKPSEIEQRDWRGAGVCGDRHTD